MRKLLVLAALSVCLCLGLVQGQEPDPTCVSISGVNANEIGTPNANPCSPGTGPKWAKARVISPAADLDHNWFRFNPNGKGHLIRMGTAGMYDMGSLTCDPVSLASANPDTFLELRYGVEREYFGRCTTTLELCKPVNTPCGPSINPGVCVPLSTLLPAKFGKDQNGADSNPLACNDNRAAAGDLGSQMEICLPDNKLLGTNNNDYCLRTRAVSSTSTFPYEVQARNLGLCRIEVEPNDTFATANPINLGETIHGIYDFAGRWPFADADLFVLNVPANATVTMETMGYDSLKVDTGIELLVGPDDAGNFFLLVSDEDSGPGYLSMITGILPDPDVLLGNTVANAKYYVNVTAFSLCPNFPYSFKIS